MRGLASCSNCPNYAAFGRDCQSAAGNDLVTKYRHPGSSKTGYSGLFDCGGHELFTSGGRITKSQAFLGHALHIRLMLRIGEAGLLVSVEKVRGANRALRELIEQTTVNCDKRNSLFFVGHCDAPESAASSVDALKRRFLNPSIRTFLVNPMIACHTGPYMLALSSCDQQLADQIRFILADA